MPFEKLAKILRALGLVNHEAEDRLRAIVPRRIELTGLSDSDVRSAALALRANAEAADVIGTFALAAVVAERVLGLRLFDVQILGALAMQRGEIAEMQTGEGKTLAAVPAIVWFALHGRGVHVLTANDYLARRDAAWMGGIYDWFGLSVGHISQDMAAARRRAAYSADITYATANEVGFDFLRDSLARDAAELVQRPYGFAVIDEADSILIDEARIPLVIAGGLPEDSALAYRIDSLVAGLRRNFHYALDENARNVRLTDAGIERMEAALGCGSLFDEENLALHTAAQDALHAHALLHRDVDYVVKGAAIELVDEFKGRIAQNRRWPAGLHSAVEAKERLQLKTQGRVLGSITVRSLVRMYEGICGMTGTAATEAREFWKEYGLPVATIPTNRPMIREDLPDIVYADRQARRSAVVEEIRSVHATGRPILVGTDSVAESETLSRELQRAAISHSVLNARNDETEAEIISQAGALGAVTVSTNMAGRGTDILPGGNPPREREKVLELGGLYVIGTTRHESRRIDNQLRGRAGRQGDPGSSRFFLSLQDDLIVRFGAGNTDIESVQRTAESQNFEIRQTLWKYDCAVEFHRREMHELRCDVLLSPEWSVSATIKETAEYRNLVESAGQDAVHAASRRIALAIMDDVWSDYLANVADLRGGVIWTAWSVGDPVRQMLAGGPEFGEPLQKFLAGELKIYEDFQSSVEEGIAEAFATAVVRDGAIEFPGAERLERGATWTYVTTDQPFGTFTERVMKGLRAKFSKKPRQG